MLLTSENEGTPVVAIEALAAERPVVATDAGGTATVVTDGESGFLVPIGDTDALAARLAELARDPELRATLGRHGAADVRARFATERMADEVEALYRKAAHAMKVLHVHKLTGVSGSENHLLALLPALRAAGVDARFLGLDVPGSDAPRFYERLDELGVPYRRVRCGLDVSPRMARDVIRAVRAERPDLLHTHLVHADVYGASRPRAPACRSSRRATTTTATCSGRSATSTARSRGRRARLIAISDAVRRFLEQAGHPPEKLVTVHYGLDELPSGALRAHARRPPGSRTDAPLLLAVGRLIAQKDHATLLRAFARVRERHPDARLAILGSGPLEAGDARARARARTRTTRSSSPAGWSPATGSRGRTSSSTPRAGRASGSSCSRRCSPRLPIVATRVSAVPEVVVDGETGLLVERRATSTALAAALDELLADPERARRLGAAGLERARSEFSVARMTERTIGVYRQSLA